MIIAKKNAIYYLSFPAIDSTAPESYKSGLSPVDTAFSKDGVGAWTSLAITDTASEIGTTGVYEIDLSASEMNHDKVLVKFSVSGMADDAYLFDLSAKLTDDLNDAITAPTSTANADELLNRDMSAVSDTNARTPLNAFRILRNKWSVTGTTMTVTKEDDTTSAWTSVVSTDAAADPVTGSDPHLMAGFKSPLFILGLSASAVAMQGGFITPIPALNIGATTSLSQGGFVTPIVVLNIGASGVVPPLNTNNIDGIPITCDNIDGILITSSPI